MLTIACWVLLAQTPAIDPITGGAGWVGAGLLGLVLGWLLLVHLPGKDKQLKDFIEAKDATIKDLLLAFDTKVKEARCEYQQTLDRILSYGERHIASVAGQLTAELARLREAIESIGKEEE